MQIPATDADFTKLSSAGWLIRITQHNKIILTNIPILPAPLLFKKVKPFFSRLNLNGIFTSIPSKTKVDIVTNSSSPVPFRASFKKMKYRVTDRKAAIARNP
jgi:hypothetical protein